MIIVLKCWRVHLGAIVTLDTHYMQMWVYC